MSLVTAKIINCSKANASGFVRSHLIGKFQQIRYEHKVTNQTSFSSILSNGSRACMGGQCSGTCDSLFAYSPGKGGPDSGSCTCQTLPGDVWYVLAFQEICAG